MLTRGFGIDLSDENFKDTPTRVAKAYYEILRGQDNNYLQAELLEIFSKSFPTEYHGIVAQHSIHTVGMCPHHMQPIQYYIDFGYIANKNAIGLSKIIRVVSLLSARMDLQETLTHNIVEVFKKYLNPDGVIVIVRGSHGCMTNRGVKQPVLTTTSSVTGIFDTDSAARAEFLSLSPLN